MEEDRMDETAVLIPCHKESQTIEKVIRDFIPMLPKATIDVYGNHSTDTTMEFAHAGGTVVYHEYKQGKGNVIGRTFQEVNAYCCLMAAKDDTSSTPSYRGKHI